MINALEEAVDAMLDDVMEPSAEDASRDSEDYGSKQINDYEVVDLGEEFSDYFQGFGVHGSEYDNAVYGIGMNPKEAFEDALEQLASSGYDVDSNPNLIEFGETVPDVPEVSAPEGSDEHAWYHVGIRVK